MRDSLQHFIFHLLDLQQRSTATSNWKDEEEDTSAVTLPPPAPSPAQMEAAKKKSEDEQAQLAKKIELAMLEKETVEERKLRERKQAEEADGALAEDLFDKSSISKKPQTSTAIAGTGILTTSIVNARLKTKEDHVNFGITVAAKISDSTSFCIAAFYTELSDRVKNTLTLESLDEIIHSLEAIRDMKKKEAEPVKTTAKKSKKAIKAEQKKHNDVFGGSFNEDKYDTYDNLEDSFM